MKGIYHVIVDGCWRFLPGCKVCCDQRVDLSAQFLNTVHRLVVAILKLQLKSKRMVPSKPRLDVGKLKEERVVEEFVNSFSGGLGDLSVSEDHEELLIVPSRRPSLMLLVGVMEPTIRQRGTMFPKGHWIPLNRVRGLGLMAELSHSGS